ncbi:MAG: S8 family serine peptidase [Halovenus sp.]
MVKRQWSRRDVLKSAGTGALGLGIGAAVFDRMDEYIVGTVDGDGTAAAATVADAEHGLIDLTEHTPMTLVCGVFSEARRESLRAREDVAFVQRDRTLTYVSEPGGEGKQVANGGVLPWGIDRVDADVVHAEGATGDGIDVAVVDSGIDDTHPDLGGTLADPGEEKNHRSWVECAGEDCNYPWSDDGGHGTHVAGTIAAGDDGDGVVGVAPGTTLHALKVCGANGGCRTSAIVEAIRYAADRGWDLINLSLGSAQEAPALQAAGQYALEAGALPVAAAGNRGRPDSVGYPAAYDEFIAVSATDIDDGIADFASTGPEVDLTAPGQDICSATVGGYDVLAGTSMATPHVTGAAAQLLADGHSRRAARERLLATAEDIGAGTDEGGSGLVDVAAALGYDSGDDGTGDGTSCPP